MATRLPRPQHQPHRLVAAPDDDLDRPVGERRGQLASRASSAPADHRPAQPIAALEAEKVRPACRPGAADQDTAASS
jgi:hypothetical protein